MLWVTIVSVEDYAGRVTVLFGLRQRLYLAKLYLVTDARTGSADFMEFVTAAFHGGADVIGLQDDSLPRQTAIDHLAAIRTASNPTHGLVVVENDPDLAEAFTADLLHLDQQHVVPAEAKNKLLRWALVGQGVTDRGSVQAALADEAVDFLTIGRSSWTSNADLVRETADLAPPGAASSKPWFAGLGTSLGELDEMLGAGARRILIDARRLDIASPEDAVRAIRERIDAAWAADPQMDGYLQKAWAVKP